MKHRSAARSTEATASARKTYRVRQIVTEYGASKPWVHKQIRDGRLDARRVDGCLFVDAESVHRLFGR